MPERYPPLEKGCEEYYKFTGDGGGGFITERMDVTLLVTAAGSLRSKSSRTLSIKPLVSSTTGSVT